MPSATSRLVRSDSFCGALYARNQPCTTASTHQTASAISHHVCFSTSRKISNAPTTIRLTIASTQRFISTYPTPSRDAFPTATASGSAFGAGGGGGWGGGGCQAYCGV
jgi:hypothetical protein